uniref:Uncharacterized protein n=1 Tax=Faxonius propinquus nudivirus TaxID=3139431 RepID=A0AAU8GF97_9VIRU
MEILKCDTTLLLEGITTIEDTENIEVEAIINYISPLDRFEYDAVFINWENTSVFLKYNTLTCYNEYIVLWNMTIPRDINLVISSKDQDLFTLDYLSTLCSSFLFSTYGEYNEDIEIITKFKKPVYCKSKKYPFVNIYIYLEIINEVLDTIYFDVTTKKDLLFDNEIKIKMMKNYDELMHIEDIPTPFDENHQTIILYNIEFWGKFKF